MINCIYHPHKEMRVVNDEIYHELLASGEWFATPTLAKEARLKDEDGQSNGLQNSEVQCGEGHKSEANSGGDGVRAVSAEHTRVRTRNSKKAG